MLKTLFLDPSRHECANNSLDIELSQVWVLLANTNEDNRLAGRVDHVKSCANFLINRVELCHDDAIDGSGILVLNSKIDKRLVELGKLINRIIAN